MLLTRLKVLKEILKFIVCLPVKMFFKYNNLFWNTRNFKLGSYSNHHSRGKAFFQDSIMAIALHLLHILEVKPQNIHM